MSLPLPLKVIRITQDSPVLKTYVFAHNLRAKPGQFVMVWLPGVDEVPMSVGWQTEQECHLGIANAGDCTAKIHERVKVGDRLGIRGPYGNPFTFQGCSKIVLVGGGYGTPPILNLAQQTVSAGIETIVLLGARNKEYLLYEKQFESLKTDLRVATDDGSKGHKGFVTDLLEKELEKGGIDCVYTCGPEKMMVKVAEMAEDYGVESQVSLERHMKCGFGICGQCCMDDSGIRLCKEGPVLAGSRALKHTEFGKYRRAASGKMEKI
ncbi:dihydroorotate dehydrogenase electron transfer subunit [Candidatus Peregrinibacteria bacterium]|nr:dihydroorotate dehydrogenase electron transfer subunit [Candidatus Peregrinibacteria bacterium]